MRNKSFLGVTVHFLEENEIYTATLGVYELEEPILLIILLKVGKKCVTNGE
jgi:hypothetical protein